MSKRPGDETGAPQGKRPYPGGGQDFMDSEPMLPEEYEDPDDEDVFLNDVLDQKVLASLRHPGGRGVEKKTTERKGREGCIFVFFMLGTHRGWERVGPCVCLYTTLR